MKLNSVVLSGFCSYSEWCGRNRGASISRQAWVVLPGQLATPPWAAQDHDRKTRTQGKLLTLIGAKCQACSRKVSTAHFEVDSKLQSLAENKRDEDSVINQLREIHTRMLKWRNVALGQTVERADFCQHTGNVLLVESQSRNILFPMWNTRQLQV